jgi:hypothetical protein
VRHIKLDRNHADFGNTPRGIGALLAISAGYEGIGLPDADNWLEKNHVSECHRAARVVRDCDFVIARRSFRRPDGTVLDVADKPISSHVDTNCFFSLPGSYHIIPHFSMMPRELAPICDRVFHAAVRQANLRAAVVPTKTVNYQCLWASLYVAAGETPPEAAKPRIDQTPSTRWLHRQTARQLEIMSRRSGVNFIDRAYQPGGHMQDHGAYYRIGRNEACRCGSGKFKYCHGR